MQNYLLLSEFKSPNNVFFYVKNTQRLHVQLDDWQSHVHGIFLHATFVLSFCVVKAQ